MPNQNLNDCVLMLQNVDLWKREEDIHEKGRGAGGREEGGYRNTEATGTSSRGKGLFWRWMFWIFRHWFDWILFMVLCIWDNWEFQHWGWVSEVNKLGEKMFGKGECF